MLMIGRVHKYKEYRLIEEVIRYVLDVYNDLPLEVKEGEYHLVYLESLSEDRVVYVDLDNGLLLEIYYIGNSLNHYVFSELQPKSEDGRLLNLYPSINSEVLFNYIVDTSILLTSNAAEVYNEVNEEVRIEDTEDSILDYYTLRPKGFMTILSCENGKVYIEYKIKEGYFKDSIERQQSVDTLLRVLKNS